MIKQVLVTIFFAKLCIFFLIIAAYFLLPFGRLYYFSNFVYPPGSPVTLQTAFKTWDAQHYLFLSEKGYHPNQDSNAFSPLFPLLIFLFNSVVHNSFFAGIFIANVCSFIAFYLFYVLIKEKYSEKIAFVSLCALLAFPTSFYFSLIYTESLFFLLIVLFFLFLQRRKLFLASLAAFFLPMVRLIGVVSIIPFVSSYILEYHHHSFHDELIFIYKSLMKKQTLFLLSPFLGLVAVMGFFYFTTGNFFAEFTAQQNFVSHYSFFSIINPTTFFHTLFTFPLVLHGFTNSILDRIFFLIYIVLLFFMFGRVSKTFFIYALCFGLLPVLSGSFMSYMRYLVIIFPIFVTLGKMSLEKKYEKFTFPFLFASMMLQTLFLIMQSLNYWVA